MHAYKAIDNEYKEAYVALNGTVVTRTTWPLFLELVSLLSLYIFVVFPLQYGQ